MTPSATWFLVHYLTIIRQFDTVLVATDIYVTMGNPKNFGSNIAQYFPPKLLRYSSIIIIIIIINMYS
jgi:hypothetical protein